MPLNITVRSRIIRVHNEIDINSNFMKRILKVTFQLYTYIYIH